MSRLLSPLGAWLSAAVGCLFFLLLIGFVSKLGVGQLSWEFFLQGPKDAGRSGGIAPVFVSTALIVFLCAAITVPLALGAAVFLVMFSRSTGGMASGIRMCLDVLASTPSIVFGLFGSAFFCSYLELGFSILSGALTLSCMVLPMVVRMVEEGLRMVPREYFLGGAALGLSRTALFLRVILPLAMPTIISAFIVGVGRALSETAALLFTSGYVMRMPTSLQDSGRTLSVHIFDLAMNVPGGDANASATALVLLLTLLFINSIAIWGSRKLLSRTVIGLRG